MLLEYFSDFIAQIIIGFHLLFLMFALIYLSGKFWSYFLNIVLLDDDYFDFKKSKKKKIKVNIY